MRQLPKNQSIEEAIPLMCMTNEYLWKEYVLFCDPTLTFMSQASTSREPRHFDVLSFNRKTTGEVQDLYFDITSFYGKGDTYPPELDLPAPDQLLTLPQLLGPEGDYLISVLNKDGIDLSATKVVFKQYSSEMLSRYVAIWYQNRNLIQITPIRAYDEGTDIPILHGYYFWRLMFEHHLQHAIDAYNSAVTEIDAKADYYKPIIGQDCMQFVPQSEYNFANDLINYTFITHKPAAFSNPKEIRAFCASLHFGYAKSLFTLEEIKSAITAAQAGPDATAKLTAMAEMAYTQAAH